MVRAPVPKPIRSHPARVQFLARSLLCIFFIFLLSIDRLVYFISFTRLWKSWRHVWQSSLIKNERNQKRVIGGALNNPCPCPWSCHWSWSWSWSWSRSWSWSIMINEIHVTTAYTQKTLNTIYLIDVPPGGCAPARSCIPYHLTCMSIVPWRCIFL